MILRKLDIKLNKLEELSRRINWWVATYISGGCILAMMAMMVIDATMRSIFNLPVRALIAFSEILLVWVCLTAFAHGLITGVHVRVTMVLNFMPRRLRLVCEVLADSIGLLCFALVTYYGWFYFWDSWVTKESAMTSIRSPVWLAKPAVPLAGALMTFEFLLRLIHTLRTGHIPVEQEANL